MTKQWKVKRIPLYAHSMDSVPCGVGFKVDGLESRILGFYAEDDAHLIAAAPGMLAALEESTEILREELRVLLKSYCRTDSDILSIRDSADREYANKLYAALARNDALIAKARGNS